MEDGVEEEDDTKLNRDAVEDWLWGRAEGIAHQRRLHHRERVIDVLGVKHVR